jgi:hypothetical protein
MESRFSNLFVLSFYLKIASELVLPYQSAYSKYVMHELHKIISILSFSSNSFQLWPNRNSTFVVVPQSVVKRKKSPLT